MTVIVTVVVAAAFIAQAQGDPTELVCDDQFGADVSVMPSAKHVRDTPTEAAKAFVVGMEVEGKTIPDDVELIDVTESSDSDLADAFPETVQIAASLEGKSVLLLTLSQQDAGWAVQGYLTC